MERARRAPLKYRSDLINHDALPCSRWLRTRAREMAWKLFAEGYLTRASQLLELAALTEDQQIRELLADCAADFMLCAAERRSTPEMISLAMCSQKIGRC